MAKKFDIIIVGSGIAGCTLAWQWLQQGRSIYMISDTEKGSSSVAAGVYNPTILKRFTCVWKAAEQLEVLNDFYPKVESTLKTSFLHPIDILRRFHDDKEVNTWIKKSIKDDLKDFMQTDVLDHKIEGVEALHGYGLVKETGWLDTVAYMSKTIDFLNKRSAFLKDSFDFNELYHFEDHIIYKNIVAEKIIFAEGYTMLNNPYFNYLPLKGNKGEVLTINVPGLKLEHIVKSSVFLMPYINDLFWVGATYSRDDLTDQSTLEAKEFLTSRLERFLKLPYNIIDHKQGIRPTSTDRRPFVGAHAVYKNYLVFNGMGSRAVLITPWAALQLFNSIYKNERLNSDLDISRFSLEK